MRVSATAGAATESEGRPCVAGDSGESLKVVGTEEGAAAAGAGVGDEGAAAKMSSGTFVDRIDPFAKRSLKKKSKKSQGSSRYRNSQDVELQQLPALKGKWRGVNGWVWNSV